jgi:lysozyme
MFGIDFADVDENQVDWPQVRAGGRTFVILRATYGTTPDRVFEAMWAQAKQAGMLRGAYHFLRPSQDVGAQVDAFLEALELEPGDLPPVVDVEEDKSGAVPTIEMVREWLSAVDTRLEAKLGHALHPMIYVRNGIWQQMGATPGLEIHPLWVVDWSHYDQPVCPATWGSGQWTFQQYAGDTKKVPGVSNQADLDKFNALKLGDHGLLVTQLQAMLVRAGATLEADGDFGPVTRDAVLAFQEHRGLAQDGIVGPKTYAQLLWP